ncbi:MAG: hypothetical protein AAGG07_10825 [Planctomycetota bacterium]
MILGALIRTAVAITFLRATVVASATGFLPYAQAELERGESATCLSPRASVRVGELLGDEMETYGTVGPGAVPLIPLADRDAWARCVVVLVTGTGPLHLSDDEVAALLTHLDGGGSIVLSPACGDPDWLIGARRVCEMLTGDSGGPVPPDHAVRQGPYPMPVLAMRSGRPAELYEYRYEGRSAVYLAPGGMNDTDGAGGGCCCCGGDELRDADLLLANIVVQALTG